jgi:DNA replication protein DnaC
MSKSTETLEQQMDYLKLHYMAENYDKTVQQALKEKWSHIDCLSSLVAGEAAARWDRSTQRRVTSARFPVIKTVEQFNWSWPRNIDRLGIQNLFHLKFIANKENIIFIGSVGLGKSHLATALGYEACLKGHSVLFTTAIDVINAMSAAKTAGRLKAELKRYLRPEILILDKC